MYKHCISIPCEKILFLFKKKKKKIWMLYCWILFYILNRLRLDRPLRDLPNMCEKVSIVVEWD